MNRINRLNVAGALITGLLVFLATPCVQAVNTLVWTGGVDNVWNTTTLNWLNGGILTNYSDGDNVVFDNSARITTNINISGTVSPNSILFSNTTAKTYTFTNGVITGTGGMLKTNNGVVYFGVISSSSTDITYPIGSMQFSGGTLVYQGAIRFGVNTNNGTGYDYATGGWPLSFGTGPITINGSSAEFRYSQRSGLSEATVITNDFVIGSNGGTINVGKANVGGGGGAPQHNIGGNIDLYGNLYVATGNGAGGISNTFSRIMTGETRLYSSCTSTVEGAGTFGWAKVSYDQRMTNMVPGATLTLIGGNQNGMVEVTGDNSGLTGGIIMRQHATQPDTVTFTRQAAMGGGSFTVGSNAYAGLGFDFDAGVLSSMTFEDGAVLGIDSNSSVNIDLSVGGANSGLWLGTARGAIYTGALTPANGTYNLGGGSVAANILPLEFPNENALTGGNILLVGNTNSYQSPGTVILGGSNSYSGGTVISDTRRTSGTSIAPILIARNEGALGTGPITLNRCGAGVPTLQFETGSMSFDNPILITNQVGHAAINSSNIVALRGDLTLYGTNMLHIMNTSFNNGLVVFDQAAAGKAVTMGSNSRLNQAYGLFDPVNPANLPLNAGYRQDANGIIVLSPGFTWADLTAGRTWKNTSTPVSAEWVGRNFAAKGATQIIDGTGDFELGAENNWLVGSAVSQTLLLGSVVTNNDGSFYADAGVKIARPIEGGNVWLKISNAATGPGLTNNSDVGCVNELAGNISGTLGFEMVSRGTASKNALPELVLSGLNTWSGNIAGDYTSTFRVMSGPGGIMICGGGPAGFVRFDGNSSLPTGNGGATAYLLALGRANKELFGYLLTGGTVDRVYTLPAGMRFVLGGGSSIYPTFGAVLGRASLAGSMVHIYRDANLAPQVLPLFARDDDTVFTLGADDAPLKFSGVYSTGLQINQGWYSSASNATVMLDRTGTNTLMKTGKGVVVLKNVQYTLADGTGDASASSFWQVGSGTSGQADGVVLETGAGISNSLRESVSVLLNGGVMGLISDFAPVLGTNPLNGRFFSLSGVSGAAGAGFAAYGGTRRVTLTPRSLSELSWGSTNPTDANYFMYAAAALILNATSADAPIVITSAATNSIRLSTSTSLYREIRVYDNPSTNTDEAIIEMRFVNSGSLLKTGEGLLTLTATNNDYNGYTYVSNGTLNVNGALLGSASNVFVSSGATLGGTGTIARTVNLLGTGTLTAGASNQVGTLTLSSNLVLSSTGTFVVDVSASGNDQVVVGGGDQVALTGSLVVVPAAGFDLAGGQQILIMTAPGGFSGEFTSIVPRGHSVVISGTSLYLKRDSPGFIFRIQ